MQAAIPVTVRAQGWRLRQRLSGTLQRAPTEAEVAEKLGVDLKRFRTIMIHLYNGGLVSASSRSNESEDLPAPDFPAKPETHPDSICMGGELRGFLGAAMT